MEVAHAVFLTVTVLLWAAGCCHGFRTVCYYDSRSYWREGPGKMLPSDIEPSLTDCTHLIYGYAKLDNETHKLTPLDEYLDLDSGKGNYRAVTNLKKRYPGLHVTLSIGGAPDAGDVEKYMKLVETSENRATFVNSARTLLKQYAFDGLDLSWGFPEKRPKKDRGTIGSLWHSVKKTFGYAHSHKDEKEQEHREGFTALARELKAAFKPEGWLLSVSTLPNVDPEAYYEPSELSKSVDTIHVMAFDYRTPFRNKDEADYPAPLYRVGERDVNTTVDGAVRWWLERGLPASKLVLGIPTYGRSWKMTSDSKISGVPPLVTDGPGEEGPHTKTPGLLSYGELCSMLQTPGKPRPHQLRRVTDPSKKLGSYAFRLPEEGEEGIWVAHEDLDSAGYKAAYVKNKSLGGVAMVDISLDDFRGVCSGEKYPLVHAAATIIKK